MQNLLILPIAAATCVATMIGGVAGISMRDRLHLVLAFSAGAVIGVAFFDLLPEAVELGGSAGGQPALSPRVIPALTGLGFLLYLLLDRLLPGHGTMRVAARTCGGPGRRRAASRSTASWTGSPLASASRQAAPSESPSRWQYWRMIFRTA